MELGGGFISNNPQLPALLRGAALEQLPRWGRMSLLFPTPTIPSRSPMGQVGGVCGFRSPLVPLIKRDSTAPSTPINWGLRFASQGKNFFHQILQLYKLNVGYFSINEYPIKNFPTSEKIFQAV